MTKKPSIKDCWLCCKDRWAARLVRDGEHEAASPDLQVAAHFEPQVILCAARWYLRFSLSYRDVEELLSERGVEVDHSTIWRWVQRFAPELNQRLRPHLKPTNRSWRVDET